MLKHILTRYLRDLQQIIDRGDAREETFYHCLKDLIEAYARENRIAKCEVTILPKATEIASASGYLDYRELYIYPEIHHSNSRIQQAKEDATT